MPEPPNDPRVFFAAERTLLAWIRTSLGLVGMGFVVAKFALFLRLIHPEGGYHQHSWTLPVGVLLSLLGAGASGVATWQHRRFCRGLGPREMPLHYRFEPGLALGFSVTIAGLVLAVVIVT